MPLPRKNDTGGPGAPVLDILSAHVRLLDVEEYTEPRTIQKTTVAASLNTPSLDVPLRSSTTAWAASTTA
jgi:hypothetical protein